MFIGSFIALITHPMWWQWVFNIDYSFISGVIWATVFFTVAAIAWIHVVSTSYQILQDILTVPSLLILVLCIQ